MTSKERSKKPINRAQFLSGLGVGAVGAVLATPGVAQAQSPVDTTSGTVFNVKDYGAAGDGQSNDSPAFVRALRAISEAIALGGGGVLYVPAGDYRFDSVVSVTKQRWFLTIVGDGQGVSNLLSANPDGIFKIHSDGRESQIAARDLSFVASHKPHAGTALEITQPSGGGRHHRNLVVQNVEMRGLDLAEDLFDYGLKALDQWRPLLWNVIFSGPYAGGVNSDWSEDSLLFAASCGIDVSGSFAPVFQNCYVWSAHTGIRNVSLQTPTGEGTFFYNCFIVAVRHGVDVRMGDIGDDFPLGGNPEPGLAIDRCHVNARDVGIRLTKGYFSVTNCLLYNSAKASSGSEDPPEYRDILLDKCIGGVISHNILHQPTNVNRIGIDVGRSVEIAIRDNFFNHRGTAVSVGEDARDIVLTNNTFSTTADPRFPDDVPTRLDNVLVDVSGQVAFVSEDLRAALVERSDNQEVPDSAWTPISWQSEVYDLGSFWDDATPGSFVVPANRGHRFVRLTANVAWSEHGPFSREVQFLKNGERFSGGGSVSLVGEANVQNLQSAVVSVQAGDALSVRVRQTSSQPLSITAGPDTWFAIESVDG